MTRRSIALALALATGWPLLPGGPSALAAAPAAAKTTGAAGAASPSGAGAEPELTLVTSMGKIAVRLYSRQAPISTQNFLAYAKGGFYQDTIFHRVIDGFMIQGGGFTAKLDQKPTQPPIKNEADNGLRNRRGTLAMARTGVVDSATAQFFINLKDNPQLDHSPQSFGYAVVGQVIGGMEVVDAIAHSKVDCPSDGSSPCSRSLPPGMRDVPASPILIQKVLVPSL